MIEEAKTCIKCELCKGRTNAVIGKGNEHADILFIGEAPGKNEDQQGFPFVGMAGKNLDRLLNEVGLSIDDIYIANILKCRPPKNRDPNKEEIKTCTPWLIKQIKHINPKVICTLGNYSTKFILAGCDPDKMGKIEGVSKLHGKVFDVEFDGKRHKVVPLYHPAAMLYNPRLRKTLFNDIKKTRQIIGDNTENIIFKQKQKMDKKEVKKKRKNNKVDSDKEKSS